MGQAARLNPRSFQGRPTLQNDELGAHFDRCVRQARLERFCRSFRTRAELDTYVTDYALPADQYAHLIRTWEAQHA
jgi:hypothetical protein